MNTVTGTMEYWSENGEAAALLALLATHVEELAGIGLYHAVVVRLTPVAGGSSPAAPLLYLTNGQSERVGASGRHGSAVELANDEPDDEVPVDPTPAAPVRDPDEPQEEEWDLRPQVDRKRLARRFAWDWSLLPDPALQGTIEGLEMERVTWRQLQPRQRREVMECYMAHMVRTHGERVSYKAWDAQKPRWLSLATNAHNAYGARWATLLENGARLLTMQGTPFGG